MKSFALSYGEKMGSFMLSNYFSIRGGIVVFFGVILQLIFIALKELTTFFVLITLPSAGDWDNLSSFGGQLLLENLR